MAAGDLAAGAGDLAAEDFAAAEVADLAAAVLEVAAFGEATAAVVEVLAGSAMAPMAKRAMRVEMENFILIVNEWMFQKLV